MTNKHAAANALAEWFKTYTTPEQQFDGEGFEELLLCAIHCISCGKDDPEEGATSEEITVFVDRIKELQVAAAALELIRDGEIATTLVGDELGFSSLPS